MRTIIMFKCTILALACLVHGRAQEVPVEIPTLEIAVPRCGGCHCVPEEGEDCPATRDKSFEVIGDQYEYINQRSVNPYSLSCNPFADPQCQTTPPQEFLSLGNEAVCGIQYLVPASSRLCARQYKVQSYPSREEAEADGAIVTHVGSCGVCSTTSDLLAFMSTQDLTPALTKCLVKVSIFGINLPNFIECVQELGVTYECANLLALQTIASTQNCAQRCQVSLLAAEPLQGRAPECELNDCLQCANEYTIPVFTSFAGRDAQRSGILAGYAYPCSETYNITHTVCPKFDELNLSPTFTVAPTPAVTSAPTSISSDALGLFQLSFSLCLLLVSSMIGFTLL